MKKRLLLLGIPLLLVGAVIAVVALRPMPSVTVMQEAPAEPVAEAQKPTEEIVTTENVPGAIAEPTQQTAPTQTQPALAAGRYETYDSSLVGDSGYTTTILFFYAAWCPECRAYEQAINAGTIPAGVQILRVTYDDEQALRQKHGVTIQSTFVRVSSAGDTQKLWNGYGKSKSLDAIIENTK